MIQVNKWISVDGFENQQDFETWLKQDEPNEIVLKMFKWFLMKLEEDVKANTYNKKHCDAIDEYSKKMIDRKIMKEEDVIKFLCQAQEIGEEL